MKKLFYIYGLLIISCTSTQHEEASNNSTIKNDSLEITLENVDHNTYDSLISIDSLEHNKLILEFNQLEIRREFDSFEPLKKFKQITIKNNIESFLIIESFESWGMKIHIINYDSNGLPISGYEIISCGGDGGYSECSKAIITKNKCTITIETTEPLDDYSGHIQTTIKNEYKFDELLNLVLIESLINSDTIKQ